MFVFLGYIVPLWHLYPRCFNLSICWITSMKVKMKKMKLIQLFVFLFQVPYPSIPFALLTQPPVKVRSWTWMTISTSGVCQRTKWGWCSPQRCGQRCSTTATWAAFEIYLLTGRARMCDAWPRSRRPPGSNPLAPKSLPNSAWATHAKIMGSAEKAGTATCATALGLDTWDAPAKEVELGFCLPSC